MKSFIREFKRLFISTSILLLVILAGEVYCQNYEVVDPDKHPLIGQLSPDIKAKTLSGKTFDLTTYRGKIIVINFWGLKCPPCYEEIIELNILGKEYKSKNVVVISLMADSRDDVLKKIKTSGEFYKLYKPQAGNENIEFEVVPEAEQIISKFIIDGVPMNFIVDQQGIIKGFSNGYRQSYSHSNRNVAPQESENYRVIAKKIDDVVVGDKGNR